MQLVASLSFFRHFISRALRLGVVVLALFTILLSSLTPSGVVYAVCPNNDPADCESDAGVSTTPTVGSAANTVATNVVATATGYFQGDKAISLLITALAAIYAAIGRAIGYLIPIVINILINILNYNSFGDSFIVTIGWPIMRDLLNMSVILILLVIAIRTMVGIGGGAQGAQQAIGRVFFAVVLLNFSKTITLLLIDASQVVMLTFVNALDVATGNFVELFQINAILSTSWDVVGNIDLQADTPNAVGFLVNSFLSTFLLAIVLMTLVILGIVFLYRIVVLWMLVVLSPVAMFFYGLGDTLPGASGAVEEWRKRFVGALTIGPILSFFLWLSLAAASQGAAIAETEGFTFFENETANAFLEIFQPGKLLSLGLGIMLLVIGMQLAASSAASLGEFSGNLVAKLPGWSAKLAKMSSLGVAKIGAKQFERRTGLVEKSGQALTRRGASLQQGGFISRTVGNSLNLAGGYIETQAGSLNKDAREKAKKRIADFQDEQLFGFGNMWTRGNAGNFATATIGEKDIAREVGWKIFTDKNTEKAYRREAKARGLSGDMIDKQIEDIKKNVYEALESDALAFIGDDKTRKEDWYKSRVRNAHLIAQVDKAAYLDSSGNFKSAQDEESYRAAVEKRRKDISDLVQDNDFTTSLINKDNLRDGDFVLALANKTMRTVNENGVQRAQTALEDALLGRGGIDQDAQNMADKWVQDVGGKSASVIRASLDARGNEQYPLKGKVVDFGARGIDSRDVARLLGGPMKPGDIKIENFNVDNKFNQKRADEFAKGLAEAKADLVSLEPTEVKGTVEMSLQRLTAEAITNLREDLAAKYMAALASLTRSSNDRLKALAIDSNGSHTGTTDEEKRLSSHAIHTFVELHATELYKLNSVDRSGSNAFTLAVADAASSVTVKALKSAMQAARLQRDAQALKNIGDSIKVLTEILNVEGKTGLNNDLRLIDRYASKP